MKKIAIILAVMTMSFVSCVKEGIDKNAASIAVTGEYSDVSANTVTLYGWCNQDGQEGLSAVYGFEYSATDLTTAGSVVKATSKDADNKYSCKITGLRSSTKYYYRAFVLFNGVYTYGEVKTITTLDYHTPDYHTPELVDLGLSVKWASFNLGASKPEEYGVYYQWAGTDDVSDENIYLDWDNCPYHTGSDYNTGWTKYISLDKSSCWSGVGSPDNKTFLDPEDDAAHVILGGSWRMPTIEEFDELIYNCNVVWTTLNGVNGRKFTSKKTGYTDKWIFLPAAGFRRLDHFFDVGESGCYWSSSGSGSGFAFGINFEQNSNYIQCYGYGWERDKGQSVRPVSE